VTSVDHKEALSVAVELSNRAGDVLLSHLRRGVTAEFKGAIDLVTEADTASERLIVEGLRSVFPDDAIVAEESGATGAADRTWYVDPLDGTTNFAHGFPIFVVSIALVVDGRPDVGVVHVPTLGETVAACRGGGTTLNDSSVSVSSQSDIGKALLATGFPYDVRQTRGNIREFSEFVVTAQAVRRAGAAALDLAYVACGRFDGFWEEGLKAWDVAAGWLLVEEAGGVVTRYDGSPFGFDDVNVPPILASNGLVHQPMKNVLDRVRDND
jgi:myo-inositol-1(or 4)-monophosphatase